MRMFYTFFFTLAFFLNSIELSLQTERNPNRNRNSGTSSSARQHSPAQTSDEERPLRGRSRSPQGRPPSGEILGHALSELGYIRLIPRNNKRLQFEFRRYVFPVGEPIRVRFESSRFVPIPTREHIVLSASNGDVFAILEYTEFLRGIYRTKDHLRVKINMISGKIDTLTSDEARDCPVGERHPILPHRFIEVVTKNDSLQFRWDPNSKRNPGSSSSRQNSPDRVSRSKSPMGRPPSSEVLGCALSELGYIRLSPRTNPSLQLQFRRYVFSDSKPIRVLSECNRYVHVPLREHIVLSASNGDIFALLEYSGVLRGIYRSDRNHSRVKINMISSEVDNMTSEEVRDCPIGENHPIFPHTFTKVVTNDDSLQFRLNPDSQEINPLIFLAELSTQTNRNSNSRSPMGRPPSSEVLGYALRELGYIRLRPRTNPSLELEFRRYVFTVSTPIRVRGGGTYVPIPPREHIVLLASNGDIFALLEYTGVLRGIYRSNASHTRVKVNMMSGAVDNMTSDEVRDCPVGVKHPIFPDTFTKVVTKYNSLEPELNPNSERNPGTFFDRQNSPDRTSTEEPSFSGRSRSPMGRPPTSEVLGYSLGELGYIRLCPRTNPSLQFEFRRYVFPDGEPILVAAGRNRYVPVPTSEHIVLSTSNGDILALLEYSGLLRGIYITGTKYFRVKINMTSGAMDCMTSDEVRDCPVGEKHPIFPQTFTKVFTNCDSLQSELNPNSNCNPGLPSSARRPTKVRFSSRQKN